MLTVEKLDVAYGDFQVLWEAELRVDDGEIVTVLGPNGAGKSTLMAAISGTLPRRAGRIEYGRDKRDLARLPSHAIVAAGVALVPEGRQIFAPLTVADNLRLGAVRLARGQSLAERHDTVFGLFPRLKERRRQRAGTLSGGEQQMLAIGRALMSKPRLLLLDEPFLGLAPLIVAEIGRALEALKAEGLTILLVDQKIDSVSLNPDKSLARAKLRQVLTFYNIADHYSDMLRGMGFEKEVNAIHEAFQRGGFKTAMGALTDARCVRCHTLIQGEGKDRNLDLRGPDATSKWYCKDERACARRVRRSTRSV